MRALNRRGIGRSTAAVRERREQARKRVTQPFAGVFSLFPAHTDQGFAHFHVSSCSSQHTHVQPLHALLCSPETRCCQVVLLPHTCPSCLYVSRVILKILRCQLVIMWAACWPTRVFKSALSSLCVVPLECPPTNCYLFRILSQVSPIQRACARRGGQRSGKDDVCATDCGRRGAAPVPNHRM